jgi:hypothetical protein
MSNALKGLSRSVSPSQLQKTVLKYGVLKTTFMVEFFELLLWYGNLTIYSLSVVYILVLRKTVYQI